MRMKVLFVTALVLPALISCGAQKKLTDRQFQPILAYYSNCTYVAENSTPVEIMRFVTMLQGSQNRQLSLSDAREKRVYDAMAATLGVILQPDPGILGSGSLAFFDQYFYSFTPLEIVAAGPDTVSVRVTRRSTLPLAGPAQPAGTSPDAPVQPLARAQPGDGPRFAVTEVDNWIKVDGRWRLKALHAYLVGA